jgi:hypothetical protein
VIAVCDSISCAHFLCLAFPQTTYLKTPQKQSIFGDELVTSLLFAERNRFHTRIGLLDYWCNYSNSSPGIGEGIAL